MKPLFPPASMLPSHTQALMPGVLSSMFWMVQLRILPFFILRYALTLKPRVIYGAPTFPANILLCLPVPIATNLSIVWVVPV
jgi:hypothetical protein